MPAAPAHSPNGSAQPDARVTSQPLPLTTVGAGSSPGVGPGPPARALPSPPNSVMKEQAAGESGRSAFGPETSSGPSSLQRLD
eukprot:91711-Rhodomonas_salina.1